FRAQHRYGQAMAYDSNRNRVVLFGGSDSFATTFFQGVPSLDDTWEWDGTDWVQRLPAHRPPARLYAQMAFDSRRGVVVLHGGLNYPSYPLQQEKLSDTWEWDGTTWTERTETPAPPAAAPYESMAYDAARGVVVLSTPDLWEWDGNAWKLALALP